MKAQLIQLERIGYYTEHMKDLNKYMQIMASIAQQPVKKPNETTRKKLLLTVMSGDSIVKDMKGWKLSDEKK